MTGIEAASAVRVLLAATGLSALLASSPVAFGLIRWTGAAYLAYLAIRAFRAGQAENHREHHPGRSRWLARLARA